MRYHFFILVFLISVISYSQNWNVFNKGYRYNYKFDNSPLISNILFVDSVKQIGTDTAYVMNNIGVISNSVLTTDQPQFLQKKIIKQANGTVILQTTNALTIVPTCTLNQSWLFDAVNNYSAICVALTTETVFSIVDSIKTILINNIDSIKLSKQFGVIQYPELYAQNQYYRLAGIENGNKYDSISLFGEKVPNAWDFYNYHVGQGLCSNYSYFYGNTPPVQHCRLTWATVLSKTITPAGYIYLLSQKTESTNFSNYCNPNSTNPFISVSTSITGLSNKSLIENRMYPGMVDNCYSWNFMVNIVKFGLNSQNVFSKFYGPTTYTSNGPYVNNNFAVTYSLSSTETLGVNYSTGVGLAMKRYFWFETVESYGAGTCTLGIGIKENEEEYVKYTIYPNPARTEILLPINHGELKVLDIFGKTILVEILDEKNKFDVKELPDGLYFLEIQSDSFKSTHKLIIQH